MTMYRVIGGCEVAGVQNGSEVSQETLDEAGANVHALLVGGHLEELPAPSETKPTGKTSAGGKDGDG